ncbi:hypothetical protein EGR_07344 [Echinococcus granulosus]|uniref:Uncharacterized protein n=1 Tax=Echinococcus granulosus TaxID=6210 RepID=W6UB63_ECHGR|nr:hypothetical protein EGR_07344 [Echinococcus granulosus]EUB57776.1 hypothetical protein EGR_07344 [Echinococcus granulosus]
MKLQTLIIKRWHKLDNRIKRYAHLLGGKKYFFKLKQKSLCVELWTSFLLTSKGKEGEAETNLDLQRADRCRAINAFQLPIFVSSAEENRIKGDLLEILGRGQLLLWMAAGHSERFKQSPEMDNDGHSVKIKTPYFCNLRTMIKIFQPSSASPRHI